MSRRKRPARPIPEPAAATPAPAIPWARRAGRATALEAGKAILLAAALTAVLAATAPVKLDSQSLEVAAAAGLSVAVAARAVHRSHRALAAPLGRATAAAGLTAAAGVLCAAAMFIPAQCPGRIGAPSRCSAQEASNWGLALVLAMAVNFVLLWAALAIARRARTLLPAARAAIAVAQRRICARAAPTSQARDETPGTTAAPGPGRRRRRKEPDLTGAGTASGGWKRSSESRLPRRPARQIEIEARRHEDDWLSGQRRP